MYLKIYQDKAIFFNYIDGMGVGDGTSQFQIYIIVSSVYVCTIYCDIKTKVAVTGDSS